MKEIPITKIFDVENGRFIGRNKLDSCLSSDIYDSFGVYCIRENGGKGIESKAIYIGVTGEGKSIKNRLKTHIDKVMERGEYCTDNWDRYRKSNPKPEIKRWTIDYETFDKAQSAKAAEVALMTHHVCRFGHAPICNDEYVEGMKYSEVIKRLKG